MRRLLVPFLLLAACAPPGVEDAYVLLGVQARQAGWAIERRAPVMPVMVDPAGPAPILQRGDDVRPIQIEAGALTWIRGWDGSAEVRAIDGDVRGDRLELVGSPLAAAALADLLEATVDPIGGERFALSSLDVLVHSADLDAPEGIEEVLPVSTRAAGAAVAEAPGTPLSLEAPGFVGVYGTGRDTLILDAAGGFTLSLHGRCGDAVEVTGTYEATGRDVRLIRDDGVQIFDLALAPGGALDARDRGTFAPVLDGAEEE